MRGNIIYKCYFDFLVFTDATQNYSEKEDS